VVKWGISLRYIPALLNEVVGRVFIQGLSLASIRGNGSIDHIGYIKWSDGIGWGKIRVRPNSTWRAVEV
jgi:hypothetical protein